MKNLCLLLLYLSWVAAYADMGIQLIESEAKKDDIRVTALIEERFVEDNRVCTLALYYKGEILFVYHDLVEEKRIKLYSVEDLEVDAIEKKGILIYVIVKRKSNEEFRYLIKNENGKFSFSSESISKVEDFWRRNKESITSPSR